MVETIEQIEQRDGIRITWNTWPVKPMNPGIIPVACLYTVLVPCTQIVGEPIFCVDCKSVLFPGTVIDHGNLGWFCVFCNNKNRLYLQNDENASKNLVKIMKSENTTIEYVMSAEVAYTPKFVLLIDICTYDEERHNLMKTGLLKMLECLPDDAMVCVIEFGTNFELRSFVPDDSFETTYCFSGERIYTKEDIKALEFRDMRDFMVTKRDAHAILNKIFGGLKKDPFPISNGFRAKRCTGAALSFAVSLLEQNCGGHSVKYMVFTQGPCTIGPGTVEDLEISHTGTTNVNTNEAIKFYRELAERINKSGHSVDIIAGTISDIGVACFQPLITLTGGTLVMAQDFDSDIFIESIAKIFSTDRDGVLKIGFDARTQVQTSHNVVFSGIVGNGMTDGSKWRLGSINQYTNLTILLENNKFSIPDKLGYVQILTQYARSDRKIILRATTFARRFSGDENLIRMGFDQEAACVFQARAFITKGYNNVMDFESAIDKNLIKFVRRYGMFDKNDPTSVRLPLSMAYFPNFMFFFRRSLLVQKDGISHDESAYFKALIFSLSVPDAVKMIKPALIAFNYQESEPIPVELDVSSLNPESFLVLDSFHNVLLWKGRYVSEWMKNNLHKNPEYKHLAIAFECAEKYSLSLRNRLPVPQYKITEDGESQARILLHYVNPSQQGIIDTEKIDYNKFYDTLCRAVVRQD